MSHLMRRRAQRVSAGAALLLLTSVGTASAECAWVLWNMSTEKPRTTYVDGAKLTAQQQCAAERDFVQLNADLAVKQGVPNARGQDAQER
jgi:hypothetical protein